MLHHQHCYGFWAVYFTVLLLGCFSELRVLCSLRLELLGAVVAPLQVRSVITKVFNASADRQVDIDFSFHCVKFRVWFFDKVLHSCPAVDTEGRRKVSSCSIRKSLVHHTRRSRSFQVLNVRYDQVY